MRAALFSSIDILATKYHRKLRAFYILETRPSVNCSYFPFLFVLLNLLCSIGHTTTLHAFKLLAHTSFLDLALFAFLCIFKVALVTEFHQVSRLVDFALEASEG